MITMEANVTPFFDQATYTWSYIVADPESQRCAVIDPVLDYDPASGKVSTGSADALLNEVERQGLQVDYILETHVHADHLTASQYMKQKVGGAICVGDQVVKVQAVFGQVFNLGSDFSADGSQFDRLLADGEPFSLGNLEILVMHTPGHTPACVTYVIGNVAFVGDTLFMPDYGTARTDFPGGDAATLFESIEKILSLPEQTVLYMCHDYLPDGRDEYACRTTVAEERAANVHLVDRNRASFVESRQARDNGLAAPRLLLPSIQVNIRAGELPAAEENEVRYLKIPLKVEMA